MDVAKTRLDEAKKAEDAEKDTAKKAPLEAARKNEEGVFQAWEAEWNILTDQVKKSTVDGQRKTWETEQAYVTDAFRILANKQLCMQCHQVGKTPNHQPDPGTAALPGPSAVAARLAGTLDRHPAALLDLWLVDAE